MSTSFPVMHEAAMDPNHPLARASSFTEAAGSGPLSLD